jgi:hypothetical protein
MVTGASDAQGPEEFDPYKCRHMHLINLFASGQLTGCECAACGRVFTSSKLPRWINMNDMITIRNFLRAAKWAWVSGFFGGVAVTWALAVML